MGTNFKTVRLQENISTNIGSYLPHRSGTFLKKSYNLYRHGRTKKNAASSLKVSENETQVRLTEQQQQVTLIDIID